MHLWFTRFWLHKFQKQVIVYEMEKYFADVKIIFGLQKYFMIHILNMLFSGLFVKPYFRLSFFIIW